MSELEKQERQELKPPTNDAAVPDWIAKHMNKQRNLLLAHADDGVIWGKWLNGQFYTSHDVGKNTPKSADISPPLRGQTLQQAFLFGKNSSELRLFHDELGAWQVSEINDRPVEETIPESQMLWGDEIVASLNYGFTHVFDKRQQGLDQILPIQISEDELQAGERPRLCVHHFIEYDDCTGEARVGLSRLVDVDMLDDAEIEEVADDPVA